jgi:hypothetical protein
VLGFGVLNFRRDLAGSEPRFLYYANQLDVESDKKITEIYVWLSILKRKQEPSGKNKSRRYIVKKGI